MISIDTSTGFGARIARQLDDEVVIWLTTVASSGTPAPTPVWFLWYGEEILISSQPEKAKLRNISARPNVAANFNATHSGGDVGVLTGTAVIDEKARLSKLEVELDQAWDLLRQRRAKREFGDDPESAQSRSGDVVEGYLN